MGTGGGSKNGGGGGGGGSQNPPDSPYAPFENSAVSWDKPDSETAAPAVSKQGGGSKPTILLFIGKDDAENCCAQTFEREVFLDGAVLELAPQFVMVRLDRATPPAKNFAVKSPAIVVLDSEADLVGRYDQCINPESVLVTMKDALGRQKTIEERTAEFTTLLAKAEKLVKDGKVHDASALVARAVHQKLRIKKALREKYARVEKDLDGIAAPRLDLARKVDGAGDPGLAWSLLRDVKNDFLGLPAAARAEAAMHALEKDPAKKEKLREFRAEVALEMAKNLAEQGRKAEALTALRLIPTDFPGSQAAADAKLYAKEISDPSWKPAPKASGHDDSVDEKPAGNHDDSVDEPEPATAPAKK